MVALINRRTQQVVAATIEVADTRTARRRGLLGRRAIDAASALVIVPCWAVHTAFMRFAIDVLFVNEDGEVVRIVSRLPAWRVAAARGAYAAVELAAGAARSRHVKIGDRIFVRSDEGFESSLSFLPSGTLRAMAEKPACPDS
jgi:uncharacterized protein